MFCNRRVGCAQVNTQPHPPETTRKVAMLQLASPVKALPVSRDADAVAQRVLDTVLDRQYVSTLVLLCNRIGLRGCCVDRCVNFGVFS